MSNILVRFFTYSLKSNAIFLPVIVHIKEPIIGKSSPCGGSGFPLSLSEWSYTICPTPYNRKYNVLSATLNKNISFLPIFSC